MAKLEPKHHQPWATNLALTLLAMSIGWLVGRNIDRPKQYSSEPAHETKSLLDPRDRQAGPTLDGSLSHQLAQTIHWANTTSLSKPELSMAAFRSLPLETLRQGASLVLEDRLKTENPLMALVYSDELGGIVELSELSLQDLVRAFHSNPSIAHTLFQALNDDDPDRAFDLAMKIGRLSHDHLSGIIASIAAKHGVPQAIDKVDQLQDQIMRRASTLGILDHYRTQEDITGALDWIQTLPDRKLRDDCLFRYAERSKALTLGETIGLVSEIQTPHLKSEALGNGLKKLAEHQPEQAFAALASVSNITEYSRLDAASLISQTLAQTNPETALQLFNRFGQTQGYKESPVFEEQQIRLYGSVFKQWAMTAPSEAKAHLETITNPEILKAAQAAFR